MLQLGIDYTLEDGKWIFTRQFLLNRGYCCKNGCRNCPYKTKNNTKSYNMAKDLYMKDFPNRKPVIQTDDLIYDGKNLIIPSYWTSTLADFIKAIDESKINDEDGEDLNTLKNFIFDVEYHKTENSGN